MNKKQKNILMITIILILAQVFLLGWSIHSNHNEQKQLMKSLYECQKERAEGNRITFCFENGPSLDSPKEIMEKDIRQSFIRGIFIFLTIFTSRILIKKMK